MRPLLHSARAADRLRALLAVGVLLPLLAALSLPGRAQAIPPSKLQPQGYVNDFAGVLSADQRASLAATAGQLEQQLGAQVAMVTVKTVGDDAVGDYAIRLAERWGVGHKGKDNGLLILLAVGDHKYSTQVGYGLEPYITDADTGAWMRALRPQLRAGDYAGFFAGMLADVDQTLVARMGTATGRPANPPRHVHRVDGGLPPGVVWLILIFIFAGLGGIGRGRGWGCLLPFVWGGWGGGFGGGGGGGWGGGGFGGGGGGGFGGFGGGGFGGGGASGGW